MVEELSNDARRAKTERHRNERGMNTAEYAVGTVAACGFAGVLFLCQDWYDSLVRSLLQFALQEALSWPRILW